MKGQDLTVEHMFFSCAGLNPSLPYRQLWYFANLLSGTLDTYPLLKLSVVQVLLFQASHIYACGLCDGYVAL